MLEKSVPTLRIDLFGGLTIRVDAQVISDIVTRKAEALLIYMACNRQPHHRELLADLLWDDLPAGRAAGNLRLTLNQLRAELAPFLDITRQTIAIRRDVSCLVDVHSFAEALAAEPRDPGRLAEALELYRGDFLRGFYLRDARGFSEWQAAQADHWRQQAQKRMPMLIDSYIAHSRYAEAGAWAARLLELDPLDEAAYRQMMLLLARSGQRQAAIRQYRACRRILRAELDLDPEPATEALYQRVRGMTAQRPHCLPPGVSVLIGRATELARVYAWLATPAARLMSIVGAGGSGKTQLALAAGWRVATEYLGPCSDGVLYIALGADDSGEARLDEGGVLMAIARAAGIKLSGKAALIDQVIQHLREKEVLLIVDNGELLGPSARLALGALVQHTAALRILAPSRERLKLREEWVLELAGLAHPVVPSRIVTAGQERRLRAGFPEFAAVQLFQECARRVHGARDFDDYELQDQIAIGRICQLVHGLPLAIELTAPWLRVCSPAEIAREIAQTIDLLVTDMPDIPERHRSVRAVFEYSWRLIPECEQAALANLSVFPGSFTAAAAAAIAAVSLPILAGLRDRSLLQSIATDAETRYALHPLLRRLAGEKLRLDSRAETAIHARHARYFAEFAAPHADRLRASEGNDSLCALEHEMDNLRAGWHWAIVAGDIATLGQYSNTLHDFCAIRSWELEGQQLFGAAVPVVRAWAAGPATTEAQATAAARVLSCYAELQNVLGELDAAEDALLQSRAILAAHAIEDSPELMFTYKQLGLIAHWRGAYADALSYLQLTLRIAEECADAHKHADILLSIGVVAYAQGNWQYAGATLQRVLAIFQAADYQWGIAHTLRFLGMLSMARGDAPAAQRYYQESLALLRKLGNRIGEALVLDLLGMLHLAEQRLEQSAEALRQGLAIFQELGVDLGSGRAMCHLGRLALAQHDYHAAHRYFLQAIEIAGRVQAPPLLIESCAGVVQLRLHTDACISPAVRVALASLRLHPACPADTRQYIAGLLPGDILAHPADADAIEPPWPLERVQELVTLWASAPLQSRAVSDSSSLAPKEATDGTARFHEQAG